MISADAVIMQRKVAIWTEWAWSQGLLGNEPSQKAWIDFLTNVMVANYPRTRVHKSKSREVLGTEVERILKILRYGGRKPADIPPLRMAELKQSITEIVKQV